MSPDRRRYTVLEVRYGIKRFAGQAEAEWLVSLAPADGPNEERYMLCLSGSFPLRMPPYARGSEVELDRRLLTRQEVEG